MSFVQVGPDGKRTTGDFYIQKQARSASNMTILARSPPRGRWIIGDRPRSQARDPGRLSAIADPVALSLLSDRIDLMRDTNVVGVASGRHVH